MNGCTCCSWTAASPISFRLSHGDVPLSPCPQYGGQKHTTPRPLFFDAFTVPWTFWVKTAFRIFSRFDVAKMFCSNYFFMFLLFQKCLFYMFLICFVMLFFCFYVLCFVSQVVEMQTLMYENSTTPRRPHNTRHETQPGPVSPWKLDHTRGSRQDICSTRVPGSPWRLWMARNHQNH